VNTNFDRVFIISFNFQGNLLVKIIIHVISQSFMNKYLKALVEDTLLTYSR